MSEFTQGVCADGAAILKDGVMLTIEEIIELLRQGDKLMGAGEEPVAWRYWNEKSKSWNETHSKLVAEAMGEGGRKVEPLYTQAPAVDSAVLRDAARYRWLREQHWSKSRVVAVIDPKTSVRLGQYCPSLDLLDLEIDTAMNKGEG